MRPTAETASLPPFDVLVIGGGINGAGIARDAAGRGLRVCLIEQADLASHTSSASTKLIHGGLRYLEYGEFRLVRESLSERERLLAIAPHLVHPLRLVLPHVPAQRPRWQIRLGLFAYDHMGGRKRLPASRSIRLARDPAGAALQASFEHAFEYSDCWVDDSRLVVLNAVDAARRGAVVLTRTRFTGATPTPEGWVVECVDERSGHRFQLRARALVNAAAAWVNEVRSGALGASTPQPMRLVQGSHIVLPRLFEGEHAYLLQNPDRRVMFVIPYQDRYTLIGTTDIPFHGDPREVRISPAEIAYLCDNVNRYFRNRITPQQVVWSFSGVRTLYDDNAPEASAVTRDYVLKLDRPTPGGAILSVIGGKITTYRKLAEAAMTLLHPVVGGSPASWTDRAALPGGDVPNGDFGAFVADSRRRWPFLPATMLTRMARAYGTRLELILRNATTAAMLGESFGTELCAAEVDHLQADEWAVTAEDVVWRRSKLGLTMNAADYARLERHMQTSTTRTQQGRMANE